jgi:hypothetical protein
LTSSIHQQPSSKFKPYKPRYQRAAEKEAAISATGSSPFLNHSDTESTSMASYSVSGYRASLGAASQIQVAPQEDTKFSKIVLKGKLGLPEGYGPDRSRKPKSKGDNDDSSVKSGTASLSRLSSAAASGAAGVTSATSGLSKLSVSGDNNVKVLRKGAVRKTTLRPVREGDEDNDDEDQGHHVENDGQEDEDDDDDEEDEDYSDDGDETVMTTASMIRMRGETPEQRKARKALVR